MKTQRLVLFFGILAALSFLFQEIIGILLWKGYNPITDYISKLTADGAPNVHVIRLIANIYRVCFTIFILGLCIKSFKVYHLCIRTGFSLMLTTALLSMFGYGLFPMTLDYIFSMKNIVHLIITVIILLATMLSLFLIAIGYLKQEKIIILGRLSFVSAILFLLFNTLHLLAIISNMNVLGLLQRLSIYTLNLFIFLLSWNYEFRYRDMNQFDVY